MKIIRFISPLVLALVASFGFGAKPKIILVHGAFADGSCWSSVIEILQSHGYQVEAVQNDMRSLLDDITHTKDRIKASQGPVIIVGHSYGGAVISGAAANEANVKALVYIAAFAPDKGESLQAITSQGIPAEVTKFIRPDSKGNLYLSEDGFVKFFANHLPAATAKAMAVSQRPVNAAAFGQSLSYEPAWKTIPSFYAVSQEDKVIPSAAEEYFAKRIGAKQTVRLLAGHASMISNPKEVAALIELASQKYGS